MTDAFAGASGADLMRPAVPRFDPLFDQVANRARSREHSGGVGIPGRRNGNWKNASRDSRPERGGCVAGRPWSWLP
jgi:hypothetical protein